MTRFPHPTISWDTERGELTNTVEPGVSLRDIEIAVGSQHPTWSNKEAFEAVAGL